MQIVTAPVSFRQSVWKRLAHNRQLTMLVLLAFVTHVLHIFPRPMLPTFRASWTAFSRSLCSSSSSFCRCFSSFCRCLLSLLAAKRCWRATFARSFASFASFSSRIRSTADACVSHRPVEHSRVIRGFFARGSPLVSGMKALANSISTMPARTAGCKVTSFCRQLEHTSDVTLDFLLPSPSVGEGLHGNIFRDYPQCIRHHQIPLTAL